MHQNIKTSLVQAQTIDNYILKATIIITIDQIVCHSTCNNFEVYVTTKRLIEIFKNKITAPGGLVQTAFAPDYLHRCISNCHLYFMQVTVYYFLLH